jgi:hypothetical protein
MLIVLLAACIDLESLGAYTCDEYCGQVIDKTAQCAEEAAIAECEAAAETDCPEFSDAELGEYAASARTDWADASRAEMVASCDADIQASGKSDTECEAETATLNNLECSQILDVIDALDG